ncbi:hypothetical protein BMA10399_A0036 [Burkholderia mallei ATCC 10399]|nr:hypothetical protein BMA10399_A0036 [Burkholderia mallei ATCC 10399]
MPAAAAAAMRIVSGSRRSPDESAMSNGGATGIRSKAGRLKRNRRARPGGARYSLGS